MAKLKLYNPPPNWPAPPEGWTPPPDWQPDPAWGPAPEGWQFWREERANPRAWGHAFLAALVPLVVLLAIGSAVARTVPTPEIIGLFVGRYLGAAVLTGVIAYVSTTRWRRWLYVLVAFGAYVAVGLLSSLGNRGGTL